MFGMFSSPHGVVDGVGTPYLQELYNKKVGKIATPMVGMIATPQVGMIESPHGVVDGVGTPYLMDLYGKRD